MLICNTFRSFMEAMKIQLIWSNNNKIQNLTPIFVFQILVSVWPQVVTMIICDNLTGVTSEIFSGVLEMFLMLDYVFSLPSFFLWEIELEISFSTYFIKHTCWFNSFHLNKKYRTWTKNFWVKTYLDVFLQNSTFFMQILMIILKVDVALKSFLTMQFSSCCLNQIFPCNLLYS